MRSKSMLLLCAVAFVACASASPYSKIPDSYRGQGFADAKSSAYASGSGSSSASSSASASASAGGYASSNAAANANADASGYVLQNPGSGFLTHENSEEQQQEEVQVSLPQGFSTGHYRPTNLPNGAAQGSASSGLPQGFSTGHYRPNNAGAGSHSEAGQTQEGGQYWWQGNGSPFVPDGKPSAGCTSSGCSSSGSFDLNKGSGGAHAANEVGQVGVQLNGNPFLGGNSGSFSAGSATHGSGLSSSFGTGNTGSFGVGGNHGSQHSGSSSFGSGSISSGSSSTSFGSNTGSGHMDLSKNPFFNGGVSSGSSSSANAGANAQASATATANANANANANAFGQNPFFGSGHAQVPQQGSHHVPQQGTHQVPQQSGQYPDQSGQYPDQSGYPDQQQGGYPDYEQQTNVDQSAGFGGITVSCNGKGKICVAKHLCNNGYVSSSVQGLTQVRSDNQNCDIDREVCCTLRNQGSGDSTSAGSGYGQVTVPGTSGIIDHKPNSGGIFGNANIGETDLSSGDQVHQYPEENNGYLPPIGGDASGNVPSYEKLPQEPEIPDQEPFPAGSGPAPTHVQLGCAAALLCVEEPYCGMDGVISKTPLSLSSEQLLRRVPLSDCKNPDNGVIGKCCRDPDYVDPWPAGNLPANYSGGFDEQGFPTFLNIQKTRPTKKPIHPTPQRPGQHFGHSTTPRPVHPTFGQPSTRPPFPAFSSTPRPVNPNFGTQPPFPTFNTSPRPVNPTFGTQPPFPTFSPTPRPVGPTFGQSTLPPFPSRPVKGQPPLKSFPSQEYQQPSPSEPKQFPNFPNFSNLQNQISSTFQNVFNRPQNQQPNDTVADEQAPNKPNRPNFPNFSGIFNFPNFTNPFQQNRFDSSPSNANPIIIAPHTPGSQCGIRNTVQRPSGLTDVDVGFGEIPWQAMILNNVEKKLLCSGAFVAPNAVLTAARCVDGFKPQQVSVKAGEWKLGYELKHEEPLPFEIVQVESIVPHPGYLPGYPTNDIAMLMLKHPVVLDQHVDTICLGKPEVPKPGSKCISTGWGKVPIENHAAGALMHAIDVDVMDHRACKQRIQNAENQVDLDETLLCAKAHKHNNNMCQVDFGGPLACDRGDGNYEIMGVYTQDTGCLPTNQVATFAMIDDAWVQHTLENPLRGQATFESQRRVETHQHTEDKPCDCQKSNLPPGLNQYLPPV